jgi:hypothetical protein
MLKTPSALALTDHRSLVRIHRRRSRTLFRSGVHRPPLDPSYRRLRRLATRWPSIRPAIPARSSAEACTKISLPPRSETIKPTGGGTDADDQPAVAILNWLRMRSAHSLTAVFDGNVSAPWTLTLPRSRRLLIETSLAQKSDPWISRRAAPSSGLGVRATNPDTANAQATTCSPSAPARPLGPQRDAIICRVPSCPCPTGICSLSRRTGSEMIAVQPVT